MAGWCWLPPSIRPVGAAGRPLALMRSADRHPILRASSRLVDHHRFCRPRSDRCCHHVKDHPRSGLKSIVSSAVSCRPVGLAAAQHRPDDPDELVGHRRDHDVERPAFPQAVNPRPELAAAPRADRDQGAGAGISWRRKYASPRLLRPRRCCLPPVPRSRDQAEPGREMAPRSEPPRLGHGGGERRGDPRADPRNLDPRAADRIGARQRHQPPVEVLDLGREVAQVSGQGRQPVPCERGERGDPRSRPAPRAAPAGRPGVAPRRSRARPDGHAAR